MSAYRFLPFSSEDILKLLPFQSSNSGESCAIIEDNNSFKTSLLFQAALSIASAGDLVFFICPRPLEQRPYHVLGMPETSPLALQCIKMVYIENPSGLLQYLCEFHTKESVPAAIAIDDIQYYVSHLSNEDQNKEAALVKLLAILEDTTAFISQKKGETCHRMVSATKGACPKNFLKRYFRELWYISSGEKEGEYFFTNTQIPAVRALFHLNDAEEIVFEKLYKLPAENDSEVQ
ncbi:uncharacterized protein LOC129981651 [Argiope bruennichi]|uniref:uncharacterized protein LOC129981651 n=1 Tax=Argiope bruennichi TaxID=94029 RepID=UPI0024956AC1|nr:uncharacterized protein LOC129981651 [Argiope bruennichi]